MKAKEALSFYEFHSILKPYCVLSPEELYGKLFAGMKRAETLTEESISRWCNGKEYVSGKILDAAVAMPKRYFIEYSTVWQDLLQERAVYSSEELVRSMHRAIQKDKSEKERKLPEAEHELLSWALMVALKNDYVEKKIPIQPLFLKKLEDIDAFCRRADIPMNVPHILDILLNEPYFQLYAALNTLKPSLGDSYRKKMHEYAKSTRHKGVYEDGDIMDSEFLFYAKRKAFSAGKQEADDIDLMDGLFMTMSNTLKEMERLVGGRDKLIAAMSEISCTGKTTNILID